MRTPLRFASAALVAGFIGLSPATAQPREQPKPEAELKKAQEQLERLLQELREQEAKKAKPDAPKPPVPPTPANPAATQARPMIWTTTASGDPAAALKGLINSKDPRTAALAKELLDQLAKSAPKGPEPSKSGGSEFRFEVVPPGDLKSGGKLEVELRALKAQQPLEWKVLPRPGEELKSERRIVVVDDKSTAHAQPAPASGSSTLRLSADGKTAAVVSGDGTVTIYDVATGKEIMKFPGKK